MQCLSNLIGISRSAGSTSESGLFLEDINITLERGEATYEGTQLSGLAFLQSKIDFASKEIVQDLITALRQNKPGRKAFTENSILENGIVGYYRDNLPVLAAGTTLKGAEIRIEGYPYTELHISQLSLMAQVDATTNIYVYDLLQDKLLDTIEITTVAGDIASVDVNKTYKNNGQILDIAILFDSSIATYITDVNKSWRGCYSCKGNKGHRGKYIYSQGISMAAGSPKIRSNVQASTGGTAGLSVQYSVNCTLDNFVCSIKNLLASPILYKTGQLYYEYLANTSRINSKTKINGEDAIALAARCESQWREKLDNLINGIQLPNDVCFKCESPITRRVILP